MEMEKEREMEKDRVARVIHTQAELGAGQRFLCKLGSRGLSLLSLTPSWSMTLCSPAVTVGQFEWSFAIFERGLNSTAACPRALVLVENRSPMCILVFLTPWISSTLARIFPGVPGWSGSW